MSRRTRLLLLALPVLLAYTLGYMASAPRLQGPLELSAFETPKTIAPETLFSVTAPAPLSRPFAAGPTRTAFTMN